LLSVLSNAWMSGLGLAEIWSRRFRAQMVTPPLVTLTDAGIRSATLQRNISAVHADREEKARSSMPLIIASRSNVSPPTLAWRGRSCATASWKSMYFPTPKMPWSARRSGEKYSTSARAWR
jgi:hypothetical protein